MEGQSAGSQLKSDVGTLYKLPLILSPQPEGGYTVVCPMLPEMITEGDTVEDALANVRDALVATIELYQDMGKPLPAALRQDAASDSVWIETLVSVA